MMSYYCTLFDTKSFEGTFTSLSLMCVVEEDLRTWVSESLCSDCKIGFVGIGEEGKRIALTWIATPHRLFVQGVVRGSW
jgi:hypothetical protein